MIASESSYRALLVKIGPNVHAIEVIKKASDHMGKNFSEFSNLASLLKKSLWASLASAAFVTEPEVESPTVGESLRPRKTPRIYIASSFSSSPPLMISSGLTEYDCTVFDIEACTTSSA